jgi:hypothetical protein
MIRPKRGVVKSAEQDLLYYDKHGILQENTALMYNLFESLVRGMLARGLWSDGKPLTPEKRAELRLRGFNV